jgi:hypothetical protein
MNFQGDIFVAIRQSVPQAGKSVGIDVGSPMFIIYLFKKTGRHSSSANSHSVSIVYRVRYSVHLLKISSQEDEFIILLTSKRNDQNWFASPDPKGTRSIFIHTSEWNDYLLGWRRANSKRPSHRICPRKRKQKGIIVGVHDRQA